MNSVYNNILILQIKKLTCTCTTEFFVGGYQGWIQRGPSLLTEKFGWIYRKSLKHDQSGPPWPVSAPLFEILDPPLAYFGPLNLEMC